MATFSGKDGKVNDGTSDIADITRWTFTKTSNNPAYASSSSAGFRKRVAGVKDGSGAIEGKYQNDTAPILDEGEEVTVKLYVDTTHFYSVPVIIDSFQLETDIDRGEVVGWSADFSTNGAWTEPTFI